MMASHSECRTAGFHPVWPPMCEQRSYRLVVWCYWSMNSDSLKWKTYSELANKIFTLWCNQRNERAIRIHSHCLIFFLGLMDKTYPNEIYQYAFYGSSHSFKRLKLNSSETSKHTFAIHIWELFYQRICISSPLVQKCIQPRQTAQ